MQKCVCDKCTYCLGCITIVLHFRTFSHTLKSLPRNIYDFVQNLTSLVPLTLRADSTVDLVCYDPHLSCLILSSPKSSISISTISISSSFILTIVSQRGHQIHKKFPMSFILKIQCNLPYVTSQFPATLYITYIFILL